LSPRDTTRAALARTKDSAAKEAQPFNTASATTSGAKGRITVDLGPELYRKLKTSAAWHDRKMNDVVRDLVQQWIADHPVS